MKMPLSNVTIDSIKIVDSKKNAGGPVCQIGLSATMTKTSRNHMKIEGSAPPAQRRIKDADAAPPEENAWPPSGEKSGSLKAKFMATELYLHGKQDNTLGELQEVTVKVSLADGFTWALANPKDETNRTVRYSFVARTSEVEAATKITEFKFSSSSAECVGKLTYNKVKETEDEPDDDEEAED